MGYVRPTIEKNEYSVIISLAINCDKHAMFADIASAKTSSKRDAERWKYFQDYMNGNADTFASPEGDLADEERDESLSLQDGDEETD